MTQTLRAPAARLNSFLRSSTNLAGLLLLLAFALLYGFTLDNGLRPDELAGGDLITHQYAQVQARFSNAPGYPLYTMGGWLWFRIGRLLLGPDANPIPILSSYSTLWALVALGLLYVLILEVISGQKSGFCEKPDFLTSWPIAFLATAFYGVTYFFWYYAVTTEQYASSVAWTLAAVLLALRWERTGRDRYLLWLGLLTGIGLAHQITVLAVIPPILWFVLGRKPRLLRRGKLIAAVAGLTLLPLLSYAYVYVRGAQYPAWRGVGEWASTWHWFWSFVSTAQGREELTWSLQPLFTAEFPALIWREMTWPGLVVGLLGWLALGWRRALLLYATLVIYIVFCWIDRLGNWYQVIMPVYALLSLGIATALAYIWRPRDGAASKNLSTKAHEGPRGIFRMDDNQTNWTRGFSRSGLPSEIPAKASSPGLRRVTLNSSIVLALVILIAYRALASYPYANAANRPEDTGLAPAWIILADDPPPGAAILTAHMEGLALSYVTQIWGQRSDLIVLTTADARQRFAGSGFVVTEAALPLVPAEVSPDARYSALGRTLVAVQPAPARTAPAGLAGWEHDFAGVVRLVGGKLKENQATGEKVVMLAWQTHTRPAEDWSVSVRLSLAGAEIAQVDRTHPVFGAYPMTRWAAGEIVMDAYPVALPLHSEADGLTVILYRRAEDGSFINLDVTRFPLP